MSEEKKNLNNKNPNRPNPNQQRRPNTPNTPNNSNNGRPQVNSNWIFAIVAFALIAIQLLFSA